MRNIPKLTLILLFAVFGKALADHSELSVKLDTEEVPHLTNWGEEAKRVAKRWYPRIHNLLLTKEYQPQREIFLKIKKSEKGVGGTSGTKITLSSHWVEKHPEDLGLVVHELTHVIQGYPSGKPWWITEGIADYIRWAIYEGKGQHWFPKPRDPEGYKKGYRVTAGFLLWLEAERAPGIVKKLNSAMRDASYSAKLFEQESGRSLDELWSEYVEL